MTASDVSSTMSECCNRWLRAPELPRPPSRNPSCSASRDPLIAGTSPNVSAAATATAAQNASMRQSSVSCTAAIVSGTNVSRNRMTGTAITKPARAPKPGKHEALDQELRDQSTTSSTDRGAHGDFAAAHGSARHQQIREVDARDQQDRCRGCEQHDERGVGLAGQLLSQGHDRCRSRHRDVLGGETQAQRCHILSGLIDRHPRLEPADDMQVVPSPMPQHLRGERGRHPDVDVARGHEVELTRHHADDFIGRVVERDRPPDRVRRRCRIAAATARG